MVISVFEKLKISDTLERWAGSASYTIRARLPPQNLSLGKVPDISTLELRRGKRASDLLGYICFIWYKRYYQM
jgi:hypothetical protein